MSKHTTPPPTREPNGSCDYDVIVCGGGPAGYSAAIASARQGAKTLLIERMTQVGGMGISGLVSHWLGGRSNDTSQWVVGGIFRELVENAVKQGIAVLPRQEQFSDVPYTPYGQFKGGLLAGVPFDPFPMAWLIEETLQAAGMDILLQCQVLDGQVVDGQIRSIRVNGKQGLFTLSARAFVDATGGADLAAACGCHYVQGDEDTGDIAGVSFMIQFQNVDEQRFMEAIIAEDDPRHRKRISALRAKGEFSYPVDILIFVKLNAPGLFMLNGNWSPAEDATDSHWRSKVLLELRGRVPHLLHLFRTYFPGMENCTLRAYASDLGVRETRRIDGISRMTVADVQAGKSWPDTIGLSCYGWDLGGSRNREQIMHGQPKPEIVPIPYGIMVPRDLQNVICPGRAVSVERQGLGPLRVMAPVMAMGEAAGVAAAQAVRTTTTFTTLDIAAMQNTLRNQGAILEKESMQNLVTP